MRRQFARQMFRVLAALSVMVFVSVAYASPTTYTSRAAFLGALSGSSQTLNFDSLAAGTLVSSGGAQGGITFTYSIGDVSGPLSLQVRNDFGTTSPPNYLGVSSTDGTFLNGDSFTMGFGGTITALGLDVIGAPGANFTGDFVLNVAGGGSVANGASPDVFLSDGDAYFLGIIDPAGFTSATMTGSTSGCDPLSGCQYVWNVDDITTRSAGTSVPEPGVLIVFSFGAAALARCAARRQRG